MHPLLIWLFTKTLGSKVELILPEELYEIIKNEILKERARPTYSRVIMPLEALLEGEFFNEYIKKGMGLSPTFRDSKVDVVLGNILMLSEGKTGVDKVYSLREGTPRLFSPT
jgi:ribonuclease P/MRP protein subunit RPP40